MLPDIIQQCIELEEQAERTYRTMSGVSSNEKLAGFWKSMAAQETAHIRYWQGLLKLAEQDKIRNIFDAPEEVLKALQEVRADVDGFLAKAEIGNDVETMFFVAYKLEFMLMHPAFAALFILMEQETDQSAPSRAYDAHINGLITFMKELHKATPLFELISDSLKHLWARNREIAGQLAEIRSLRGLIPICMHCHNIREDSGFWTRVEHYIEDRSDATFSHGICPDCLEKYYAEFMDDDH